MNNKKNIGNLNVFHFGYMPWRYIPNWPGNIKQFFRNIKFAYQRCTRGYCDCDTWAIDNYLSELMPVMLRDLSKNTHSFPPDMTEEKWDKILNDIAKHFENTQEWNEDLEINKKRDKAYKTMERYVAERKIVKEDKSDMYNLKTYYHNEDMYNKAKDKWLELEKQASEFRNKEKDKAFDMMKKYYWNLWD